MNLQRMKNINIQRSRKTMLQKNIDVSKIIREGRMRKGLTQKQLAKIMGVRPPLVSKWEHKYQIPRAHELIKLANLLEIVTELFPGYEKKGRSSKISQTDIEQEIKEIWKAIRQRDQEEADFKKIMLLLLKEKLAGADSVNKA